MTIILDVGPLGPFATMTKGKLVSMAYEEAGMSGWEFDITPGEQAAAIRRLDVLMAEYPWSALGYAQPEAFGESSVDDQTSLPSQYVNTAVLGIAFRLFPMFGKSASPETRAAYAVGMRELRAAIATIPTLALPANTPRGQGNKPGAIWRPWVTGDTVTGSIDTLS